MCMCFLSDYLILIILLVFGKVKLACVYSISSNTNLKFGSFVPRLFLHVWLVLSSGSVNTHLYALLFN